MFTALLDTCVLWPSLQRDFLLSLAVEGAYRPIWSAVILEELEYEEAGKWVDRGVCQAEAERRAARLIAAMREAFSDAEVEGWDGLEGSYGLPDPDDEHVLAAAVVGGAGAIVTENTRDFPSSAVPGHVKVLTPRQFAADTVEIDPARALTALRMMSMRLTRPPLTVSEIVQVLRTRYKMVRAVDLLSAERPTDLTL